MSANVRNCDVLVVGLGPAGGAAAAAAAAAGLDVVAVEKRSRVGEPVQCAEFVPRPMAEYLLSEEVLQQPITGMRTWLPSGEMTESDFPGFMIDRAVFDRSLAERAAAMGTDLWLGTRLREVCAEEHRAVVVTAGETRELHYNLLVAADGPNSRVAQCLGLSPLQSIQTRQYTVPLVAPYAYTDIWLSPEYPGGYAWLFPRGREANLGLGFDPRIGGDLKAPLERLHARLCKEGRVGAEVLRRTGGAIPVGGLRPRLVEDAVLFVGDAAGLTHPVTGAGIPAAVMSGERAGTACAAAIKNKSNSSITDFDQEVRDLFDATIERGLRARSRQGAIWTTPAASEDAEHRRAWIAFPEYYAA